MESVDKIRRYIINNGCVSLTFAESIAAMLREVEREHAEGKLVTCKDCKHATMSTQGYCKYCDRLCANDDGEPDFQVNFDADFFCGFAERREA